ncbi:MAG: peptide deformylase [Verrucomicrobiales bacterium]
MEITLFGHPVLRMKGQPVSLPDPKLPALIEDMLKTMASAHGVGLAAQQVGLALQLAVVDVRPSKEPSELWLEGKLQALPTFMPLILINPHVEPVGFDKSMASEGCLSFPEIHGDVRRPARVKVSTQTLTGEPFQFEATGLLARAIQHEVDHLNGILFVDRMNAASRSLLGGRLRRLKKEGEFQAKTLARR